MTEIVGYRIRSDIYAEKPRDGKSEQDVQRGLAKHVAGGSKDVQYDIHREIIPDKMRVVSRSTGRLTVDLLHSQREG